VATGLCSTFMAPRFRLRCRSPTGLMAAPGAMSFATPDLTFGDWISMALAGSRTRTRKWTNLRRAYRRLVELDKETVRSRPAIARFALAEPTIRETRKATADAASALF